MSTFSLATLFRQPEACTSARILGYPNTSCSRTSSRWINLRLLWNKCRGFRKIGSTFEARASGNPTKDQYRLMMQSLLAERCKFAVHYEMRQVPIFGLVLAKPGKLGPQIRLHSADDPVCANPPPLPPSGTVSDVDAAGYPAFCDGLVRMKPTEPGRLRFGGRNLTMAQIAASPMRVMADVGRPLVDQTGIKETVDFTLEWVLAARNVVDSTDFHPDESAPEFDLALTKQLGLKLKSQKGLVEVFVIDHIEHPSEN